MQLHFVLTDGPLSANYVGSSPTSLRNGGVLPFTWALICSLKATFDHKILGIFFHILIQRINYRESSVLQSLVIPGLICRSLALFHIGERKKNKNGSSHRHPGFPNMLCLFLCLVY